MTAELKNIYDENNGLEEVKDSTILVKTFDQWGQEMDDENNIHDFGGHLCLKAIENISPSSNSSTMYSYQADPISSLTKLARWCYFGSALRQASQFTNAPILLLPIRCIEFGLHQV